MLLRVEVAVVVVVAVLVVIWCCLPMFIVGIVCCHLVLLSIAIAVICCNWCVLVLLYMLSLCLSVGVVFACQCGCVL